MVAPPKIVTQWSQSKHSLHVIATFPDGSEPQKNELWTALDRHPDYSMQMEYDAWLSVPMTKTGTATYEADFKVTAGTKTVNFVTVHAHEEAGSTITLSSPALQTVVR